MPLMIGTNLIVEGVPGSHHHHQHGLGVNGSHPIHNFSAIRHLNPTTVSSRTHLMTASTFGEPFLKNSNNTLLPPSEFLRPLPKPAPIVATRYNGVTNSLNGNIKSRLSEKYPESDPQGPVNLVQSKETSSDNHTSYGIYTSSRLYTSSNPSIYNHFPQPSSIQTGPYGTFYPPNPFTPMLHRDNRSTHLLQLQQYPNSNTPILKNASSPSGSVFNSAKNVYEYPKVPVSVSETSNRIEKRSFKVPSGKEGSLKHRILTRPETMTQEKTQRNSGNVLPHQTSLSTSLPNSKEKNGTVNSLTESEKATSCCSVNNGGDNANGSGSVLPNFSKGSLIKLANGELKKVEDMQTEDFLSSAAKSLTVKIDPSTVVRIQEHVIKKGVATLTLSYGEQHYQVDFETSVEHPYFVFGRGWSSYSPNKTLQKYGLQCHQLQVGDICVSLTPKLSRSAMKKSRFYKTGSVQNKRNGHRISDNAESKISLCKKNDLKINSNHKDEISSSNNDDNNNNYYYSGNKNTKDNVTSSNNNNSNYYNLNQNLMNNQEDVHKYDVSGNDSNNNIKHIKDSYNGFCIKKKRRRWSAPDQIIDQCSPASSPLSSSSILSSSGSACSTVISSKTVS